MTPHDSAEHSPAMQWGSCSKPDDSLAMTLGSFSIAYCVPYLHASRSAGQYVAVLRYGRQLDNLRI